MLFHLGCRNGSRPAPNWDVSVADPGLASFCLPDLDFQVGTGGILSRIIEFGKCLDRGWKEWDPLFSGIGWYIQYRKREKKLRRWRTTKRPESNQCTVYANYRTANWTQVINLVTSTQMPNTRGIVNYAWWNQRERKKWHPSTIKDMFNSHQTL